MLLILSAIVVFNFSNSKESFAAANGDYRSFSSGNWALATTWEKYNGTAWVPALTAPTSADGVIEIRAGHLVTTTTNITADQILIGLSGSLLLNAGTLTLANGAGTDITINGTLDIFSTLSFSASATSDINGLMVLKNVSTLTLAGGSKVNTNSGGILRREGGTAPTGSGFYVVNNGGTYQHNMDGGTLPSATWNSGSTCEIKGANTVLPSGITQTFANLTWNCTGQVVDFDFAGSLKSVTGNFTVSSTGTANLFLDSQGNNNNLTVGGDFYQQGGNIYLCINGATTVTLPNGNLVVTGGSLNFNQAGGVGYGNVSAIADINGDLIVSGGTLDMSQCNHTNSGKGNGIINLSGNMTVSGSGRVTASTIYSKGIIYFDGTTADQYFVTNGNITGTIDYIVEPSAVLRMNDYVATGTGDFTLNASAGIVSGHTGGLALTGSTGNVQCSGTRTFSNNADYTYNSTADQITGTGLPSTVRDLTFDNSTKCTLTATANVTETLKFTQGVVVTNSASLILGTSTSNLGTLERTSGHVYGNLRRWVAATATSNILFPLGTLTTYNAANLSFTTSPSSGGSLLGTYINSNPGANGIPLSDGPDYLTWLAVTYWSFAPMNGFSGGVYNLNLTCAGFNNVNDYTKLHTVRRANGASNWTVNGTHTAGTGSNAVPISNRIGMNAFGHFGIGSLDINPLPVTLVSFDAISNKDDVTCNWITSSELNNDYFTLERSVDGTNFSNIAQIKGARNSNNINKYKYIDTEPLSGISYYRLTQTDYDGHSETFKAVAVKHAGRQSSEAKIIVAPNPFDEVIKLSFESTVQDVATIVISSVNGKSLYNQQINIQQGQNTFTIPTPSNLIPGTYLLRVVNDDLGLTPVKIIRK